MPKKIEKHETIITIALIIIYLVSNSFCLNTFGSNDYRTAIFNILLSTIIILFILFNKLVSYYKLDKITNPKKFLYFIPLIILMSVNLWHGININNTVDEIIIHIITMIGIGFLEEIIFRGFLFQMLAKDNIKTTIIVTSLTFGENSSLQSIGEYAFFNCIGLNTISIPSSVETFGNNVFEQCRKLIKVIFMGVSLIDVKSGSICFWKVI